jgi:hypothetical protein
MIFFDSSLVTNMVQQQFLFKTRQLSLFTVDAVGPLAVGLSCLVTVAMQSKGCDAM